VPKSTLFRVLNQQCERKSASKKIKVFFDNGTVMVKMQTAKTPSIDGSVFWSKWKRSLYGPMVKSVSEELVPKLDRNNFKAQMIGCYNGKLDSVLNPKKTKDKPVPIL
jgi:hypothetical protein